MIELSMVILANDPGLGFRSQKPPALHTLAGKPLLQYALELAAELGATPIVVTGAAAQDVICDRLGPETYCVTSTAAEGTIGALYQALDATEEPEQLVILPVELPLLRVETVRSVIKQQADRAAVSVLGESEVMCLGREALRKCTTMEPPAFESWLAQRLAETDAPVSPHSSDELLHIKTRVELSHAAAMLRDRINRDWMLAGVTLLDPATTYIEAGVTLGRDTVIAPNTYLRGETAIGADCRIGPHTIIESSTIGDRCKVLASVLEFAVMEDDSDIGPFGHLRKGARICKGAHMGNFGEMKNSTLGPGAKMGHFSYLGDAEVGAEANIGAGTITCNYDGVRKHRTTIEEGAFIGSDTLLVAPVTVGARAKTGAGAVVTHDLPPESLAYGVPARVKGAPTHEDGGTNTDENRED